MFHRNLSKGWRRSYQNETAMTTTEAKIDRAGQSHARAARLSWREKLNRKFHLDRMPVVRKVVYSVIGLTVLLLGIAMVVLPGPAIIFIPLGLAILASEYAWARRIIRRGRVFVEKAKRTSRWWSAK
jgi:Putative transmembrane protein (PGPGW)